MFQLILSRPFSAQILPQTYCNFVSPKEEHEPRFPPRLPPTPLPPSSLLAARLRFGKQFVVVLSSAEMQLGGASGRA